MAKGAAGLKNLIWFVLLFVGCSESATELTAWQKAMRNGSVDVIEKQDETLSLLKDNTAALTRIENKLEASLSAPKPNGEEVIKSAQKPPAKAKTPAIPSQVATPGAFRTASDGTRLRWNIDGNWDPTILETSAHLGREHGIDTDGMTHQEMADLHADLHDGKSVATAKPRVQNAGSLSSCPGGTCPTNTRRRGGLFGGLFR